MYLEYWQLKERPFQNLFDPKYLFYSRVHEEALVRLLYTVSEAKGLMFFTGAGGVGKTFITKVFSQELQKKGYRVTYISSPDLSPLEFLQQVNAELGLPYRGSSKVELLMELRKFSREAVQNKSGLVILVDEVQLIHNDMTLEEIRLLLDHEAGGEYLANIVLVGEEERCLTLRRVPQLERRIAVHYNLLPLTIEETGAYLAHRLAVAGRADPIFQPEAVAEIYAVTRGIPLEINQLSDLSLFVACGANAKAVDVGHVLSVVEEWKGVRSIHG